MAKLLEPESLVQQRATPRVSGTRLHTTNKTEDEDSGAFRKVYAALSYSVFPLILLFFAFAYEVLGRKSYKALLREDGPVENLEVALLLLSAGLAIHIACRIKQAHGKHHWFFWAFFCACLFFAVEELSWGQRVFQTQSPSFFRQHNRQGEINLHNFVKHSEYYSAALAGACGVLLPLLHARSKRVRLTLASIRLVTPPPILIVGFLSGVFISLVPLTRREPEVAELIWSICLFLFMIYEAHKLFRGSSKNEDQEWRTTGDTILAPGQLR